MKLFSIIIPAYNAEKSIEECIDSIILQDMQNYEVIIVDDKSNDNTIEKLRKYKEDYENIKVIRHTKNKKAGGARNTGINSAQGDYILFLDADDKIIGNSLTKLEKVINENNKPDVIYMGFQYKTSQNIYLPNEDSAPAKRLAEWEFPNVWDVLWKREFILKNHLVFEEEKYYEDFMFYYQGVLASNTYAVAPFVTHIYTDDNESITRKKTLAKIKDYCYMTLKAMELANEQEEVYQKALLKRIEKNAYWVWIGTQKLCEDDKKEN